MRILFQGDSITDGNRLRDNPSDLNHQIGHSYAYILTAHYGARFPERGLAFVNRGCSGNRARDIAVRMEPDILALQPDLVSLLAGVNDVCRARDVGETPDLAAFERVYRSILTAVREQNPRCVLVLLEPFLGPDKGPSEDMAAVQQIIRELAAAFHALHVPLQQRFEQAFLRAEPRYWLWDGVHPTEAGHQLIADAWQEAVEPSVPALRL